jgi:predicted Zn-dependent protease
LCDTRLSAQKICDRWEHARRRGPNTEARESVVEIRSQELRRGLNFYSKGAEERLGGELAEEVESDLPIVNDDLISEYVNRVARRVWDQSNTGPAFVVKIFVDDDDNASALPGGHIYITTALLLKSRSEAELAGVIAHEVGHIAARHRTRKLTREHMWNFPFLPIEWIAPFRPAVEQLPRVLSAVPSHQFNRGCEYEADLLAIKYVSAAGYDPQETLHVLERWAMQEKHRSIVRRLLDDQPPLPSRVRRTRAQIGNLLVSKGEYMTDTIEFHELQKHLRKILEN